jgi:hypothetical protein
MNYKILHPFSPPIYKSILEQDSIDLLKDISNKSRDRKINVGNTLAGNITEQYQAIMDVPQTQIFHDKISKHVSIALKNFEKKYFKNPSEEEKFNNIDFSFGEGAWINFQKSGEFNPIHHHTGMLSAVIYIDVPAAIAEENKIKNSNAPSAGAICWIYGNAAGSMLCTDYMYTHQPTTGEIFIFPSGLQHLVYPFSCQVERISMSFNVYDVKFKT